MKDLQKVRQSLPSYQSTAQMTIYTSSTTIQTYYIETMFQSPTAYRITLSNANHQVNQIVIRNQGGLFVVSPQNKKTFRFQGEWIESQGQPYLYHLMLDHVLKAKDVRYVSNKDGTLSLQFPNTQVSPWVVRQLVALDSKTLLPKKLEYMDKDGKIVVRVEYTLFKTGVTFQDNVFQTQSVLTGSGVDIPAAVQPGQDQPVEPKFLPAGVSKQAQTKGADGFLLQYQTSSGTMTIEENTARNVTTSVDPNGKIYDLFGVPAVSSTSDAGTLLQWIDHGTEYTLYAKLPFDTLWQIAESMINQ